MSWNPYTFIRNTCLADLSEIGIAMQNKTYIEQPKCVLVDKMKVKKTKQFFKVMDGQENEERSGWQ
jgi:hypothetical protein